MKQIMEKWRSYMLTESSAPRHALKPIIDLTKFSPCPEGEGSVCIPDDVARKIDKNLVTPCTESCNQKSLQQFAVEADNISKEATLEAEYALRHIDPTRRLPEHHPIQMRHNEYRYWAGYTDALKSALKQASTKNISKEDLEKWKKLVQGYRQVLDELKSTGDKPRTDGTPNGILNLYRSLTGDYYHGKEREQVVEPD